MDLNKKILKFALTSIIIIFIITIIFTLSIKLEEPVFLKSYIEESVSLDQEYYQTIEVQIIYITNSTDYRKINHMEFIKSDKDPSALLGSRLYDRSDTYGLYRVNTVAIELDKNEILTDFDRLELNKVKVTFNNGDTLDVDLGRIILNGYTWNEGYFGNGSGSGSSDGTSSSQDTLKRDIRLIRVESPLFKDSQGLYEIKIDGKDYTDISNMTYKKGDQLRIDTSFKVGEGVLDRYTQYELQPRLYFENSEGEILYKNIYNIRHITYYFKFMDILNYLKLRGEI